MSDVAESTTSHSTSADLELLGDAATQFFRLKGSEPHVSLLSPNSPMDILLNGMVCRELERKTGLKSADHPLLDFLLGAATANVEMLNAHRTFFDECIVPTVTARDTHSETQSSMSSSSPSPAQALPFIREIMRLYEIERSSKIGAVRSPMPWSSASLAEAAEERALTPTWFVPPTFIDFNTFTLHSDFHGMFPGDLVYFPDTLWLGAKHDGFPLCLQLSDYTRLRHTNAFTRLEDAALWQCALVFGFLEAVMEIQIPEDFLLSRDKDGRRILTSRRLSMLLFDWHMRIFVRTMGQDQAATYAWRERVKNTMSRVGLALDEECTRGTFSILRRGGVSQDDCADIICALSSLLELLVRCAAAFGIDMTFTEGLHQRDAHRRYVERLRAANWCPTVAELLPANLCVLGYAVACEPYIRETSDEHQACEPDYCRVLTIDETRYVTKHVSPSCTCPFIAPSIDSVRNHLEQGQIPVVVPDGSRLIVRSASDGPFVAISHVWADGLGSTTEHGLPTCQIERLAQLARGLVPNGAFWIDSVCVPERRDLRKRAISYMARTYEQAGAVIVIDAAIRAQCSSTASLQQNLLRIATSPWMQRVWTLQEGMLAQKLFFEFSDGLVDAVTLRQARSLHLLLGEFYNPIIYPLLSTQFFMSEPGAYPHDRMLGTLLWKLGGRRTSKAEDETVAIAGLLGLDPSEFFSLPNPHDRIKTLLLRVGRVPRSLLFSSGARLDSSPGFRWAPRSLTTAHRPLRPLEEALCTVNGLRLQCTVVRFPQANMTTPHVRLLDGTDAYDVTLEVPLSNKSSSAALGSFNAIILEQDELPGDGANTPGCAAVYLEPEGMQRRDNEAPAIVASAEDALICEYRMSAIIRNITHYSGLDVQECHHKVACTVLTGVQVVVA